MVSYGDISLESYVAQLEDEFVFFEEIYGGPDSRVDLISLREDLLRIPRVDIDGTALSMVERTTLLRTRLTDATLLDRNGYLSISFSTSRGVVSPLTFGHKLSYLEGEIVGRRIGDAVARIYVGQSGLGRVRTADGSWTAYAFPPRTAVLNTSMNGIRVFTPDFYQNDRLRERPVVNSDWRFTLNQRDEYHNQDVDLRSLDDIRLYIFYNDFSSF